MSTGKELRRFGGHREYAYSVAFSPDGKVLATGDIRSIFLWDLATGKRLRTLEAFTREKADQKRPILWGVLSLAFSSAGKTLAAGEGDWCCSLWDVASGQRLRRIGSGAKDLKFLADGQTLVCDHYGLIQILNIAGKELHRFPLGNEHQVHAMSVTPDETTLVYGGPRGIVQGNISVRDEGVLSLWDVALEKEVRRTELPMPVYGVAVAPDGKTLAYTQKRTIHLADLASGKELRRIEGAEASNFKLQFTPDGKTLAAHGHGSLHFWDVASGRPVLSFPGHAAEVSTVAFTPDGKLLISASGQDGTARLWDASTGKLLRTFRIDCENARVLPVFGTKVLASPARNRVTLWDARTGRSLYSWQIDPTATKPYANEVLAMGLSPDGNAATIVSTTQNNDGSGGFKVTVRDLATGKDILQRPHVPAGRRTDWYVPTFSPDGSVMAETSAETIVLREVATGRELQSLATQKPAGDRFLLSHATFSADGRFLAAVHSADRVAHGTKSEASILLWELASGKELTPITVPYTPVLAFSPDGRFLASAAKDYFTHRKEDTVVHLWEAATGTKIAEFRGHEAFVNSLAFSPDSQTLATGLTDCTVLLWDLRPFRQRLAIKAPGPEELSRLWDALASDDVGAAVMAMGSLTAAPSESVRFLRERLKPAANVEPERLRQLIADLDSEQFAVRRAAQTDLAKLDTLARLALEAALAKNPSLETRRRVEQLLEKMRGPITLSAVLRDIRAVAVLQRIGTPEARQILEKLAAGAPAARLTSEAKAALGQPARHSTPR